MTSDTKDIRMF